MLLLDSTTPVFINGLLESYERITSASLLMAKTLRTGGQRMETR